VVDRVVELTDASFGALVEPSAGETELRTTAATNEVAAGDRFQVGREPSATVTAFLERRPVFVGTLMAITRSAAVASRPPASRRRCASRSSATAAGRSAFSSWAGRARSRTWPSGPPSS